MLSLPDGCEEVEFRIAWMDLELTNAFLKSGAVSGGKSMTRLKNWISRIISSWSLILGYDVEEWESILILIYSVGDAN